MRKFLWRILVYLVEGFEYSAWALGGYHHLPGDTTYVDMWPTMYSPEMMYGVGWRVL